MNRIIHGDFNEIAPTLLAGSFDLIITDPPYARKFQHTYLYLAQHAPRLLKDGGSLLTIVPHYNLPLIFALMGGTSLKWRWPYIQDQESGPHPRMAMGIEVCYKLFGHWVKRAYPSGRGFLRDKVPSTAPNKAEHVWTQDLAPYLYYVERLCPPGGLVLDPYCGTGTSLRAALLLGRSYVGIDIDKSAVALARKKVRR